VRRGEGLEQKGVRYGGKTRQRLVSLALKKMMEQLCTFHAGSQRHFPEEPLHTPFKEQSRPVLQPCIVVAAAHPSSKHTAQWPTFVGMLRVLAAAVQRGKGESLQRTEAMNRSSSQPFQPIERTSAGLEEVTLKQECGTDGLKAELVRTTRNIPRNAAVFACGGSAKESARHKVLVDAPKIENFVTEEVLAVFLLPCDSVPLKDQHEEFVKYILKVSNDYGEWEVSQREEEGGL
jgi:hypothetical protein